MVDPASWTARPSPGKTTLVSVDKPTLTEQLAPVQRSGSAAAAHLDGAAVHQVAVRGVAGPHSTDDEVRGVLVAHDLL